MVNEPFTDISNDHLYKKAIEEATYFDCQNQDEFDKIVDNLYNSYLQESNRVKDNPNLPGHQPQKYYAGVSAYEQKRREAHFKRSSKMSTKDPDAYRPAPGDQNRKTIPSKYTQEYKRMYGENLELYEIAGLRKKASKSGISYGTLKKVYDRGMAAWRTGHRPGTTPQQWAMARVNSYITKGKTYYTADKDLREQPEEINEFARAITRAAAVTAALNAARSVARAVSQRITRPRQGRTQPGREPASRPPSAAATGTAAGVAAAAAANAMGGGGQQEPEKLVQPSAFKPVPIVRGRKPGEKWPWAAYREILTQQYDLNDPDNRQEGTTRVRKLFQRMTPGQEKVKFDLGQDTIVRQDDQVNLKRRNTEKRSQHYLEFINHDPNEELIEEEVIFEERKVTLNKPFRTPGGPKKFSVYVKNDKGNVVKVNFGDPNLSIKRDQPARRKSFRARHNCSNPGPRWKARYWSCRMWTSKPVSDIV